MTGAILRRLVARNHSKEGEQTFPIVIELKAIQKTYRMLRPSTPYAKEHNTWQLFLLDQDVNRTTERRAGKGEMEGDERRK